MGILEELNDLLAAKNKDYGEDNLVRNGQPGIIMRCNDKLSRLEHIGNTAGEVGETRVQEWLDIAGYAIQAVRLIREEKI